MDQNKTSVTKPGTVDRRGRKTKKQLRQGLTQLLQTKNINEISVRELSDLVDINRGTFYLHYRDIYDLLDQIEQEMFEQFSQTISRHSAQEFQTQPSVMFLDIFSFISEHEDMCKVLLSSNGDLTFVNRLKEVVRNKALHDWMEVYHTNETKHYDYFFSFIVSGCIGLMQTWLEGGKKESCESMAQLAERMIVHGVGVLSEP